MREIDDDHVIHHLKEIVLSSLNDHSLVILRLPILSQQ